jgi:hypothetical protein
VAVVAAVGSDVFLLISVFAVYCLATHFVGKMIFLFVVIYDRGKDKEIEENSQRNREMVKIQHIYREPICFSFTHWFSITNVASYS